MRYLSSDCVSNCRSLFRIHILMLTHQVFLGDLAAMLLISSICWKSWWISLILGFQRAIYEGKRQSVFIRNDFNILMQAAIFGDNDRAVTPSFPYLLNKVSNPSLPYFHYYSLMFHYCSCLISVVVFLQNCFSLSFRCYCKCWLLPLYVRSLPFQWNEGTNESFVVTLTVK